MHGDYLEDYKQWKKSAPTDNGYKEVCVTKVENGYIVKIKKCTELKGEEDYKKARDAGIRTEYQEGGEYKVECSVYISDSNPLEEKKKEDKSTAEVVKNLVG